MKEKGFQTMHASVFRGSPGIKKNFIAAIIIKLVLLLGQVLEQLLSLFLLLELSVVSLALPEGDRELQQVL